MGDGCWMLEWQVAHSLFHVLGVVGYTLVAHEAASALHDEQVVLYAHAAEVLILLNLVEAEEVLAAALAAPQVDEMGMK